jgi:hypothetical protein
VHLGGGGGTTTSCTAIGTCADAGGAPFACSGATGCPSGDLCCASGFGGGGALQSTCAATCGAGEQPICQTNPDCPTGDRCFLTGAGVGFCFAVPIRDAGGG